MLQIFEQSNRGHILSVGQNVVFYRTRPYEMIRDQNSSDDPYNLEERKVLDQLLMDIHNLNSDPKWKKFSFRAMKLSSTDELMNLPKVKELKDATIVFKNKIVQLSKGFDPYTDLVNVDFRKYEFALSYVHHEDMVPSKKDIVWNWNEKGRKASVIEDLLSEMAFSAILCVGLVQKGSLFYEFLTYGTPETTRIYDPRLTLFIAQFLKPHQE